MARTDAQNTSLVPRHGHMRRRPLAFWRCLAPAGEVAAQPSREDVLRNLGMKTQQQKKKERHQAQKTAKKAAAAAGQQEEAGSGSDEDEEGSEGRGSQQARQQQPPLAQQQQQQPQLPADEREAPPFFVPSKSFRGARPGYVFKKGRQGLGYYLDGLEQRKLAAGAAGAAPQAGAAGGGAKRRRQADAAKQAQKLELQELKKKYTHAPIGGYGGDASKPAASAKARREQQERQAAAAPSQQQAAPMLPGRLKELKRQRELAAAEGTLTGYSSSEDEGPPPAVTKRLKALPGRLRKKLAKQRAAQG